MLPVRSNAGMSRLRPCFGLASFLMMVGVAPATMAPSAFLTVIWVSGEAETTARRAAFPGVLLVERDPGRSVRAPRSNPISAIRSEGPGDQPQLSGPLGAIFEVPAGELLGFPPAPVPTETPAREPVR